MGFFISTMVCLLFIYCFLFNRFAQFNRCAPFNGLNGLNDWNGLNRVSLSSISRRAFFGLDQASMSAVAIGMILGPPAAADGDGRRLSEFQDVRGNVRDCM